MKAGQFNIHDYLEKLNEEATPMMSGGEGVSDEGGILIPNENKKTYDWLKKEYQAGQTEVKVEINMGGANFEPGYDLQTDLKSVKDFKPGMFGEVKTADTPGGKESGDKKSPLDAKKANPVFTKGESDATKKELPKTNASKGDIKDKEEHEAGESKEKEEKEEHEAGESKEKEKGEEKKEKPEVKKIDLKTKKH